MNNMPPPNYTIINSQLKRTLKDSLIYLPSKIIPAIIGIALIRILTSLFSPEEYGLYQIGFSTFGLIKVFSMNWLASSVLRFYLEYKNHKKEKIFFTNLLICAIGSALIVSLSSYIVIHFIIKNNIEPQLYSLLILILIASIFNTIFEIFIMVFRAGLEASKFSFYWILFAIGKPIIGIALIYFFHFRVEGIFWGFIIAPLILDIFIIRKLKIIQQFSFTLISKKTVSDFIKYGFPISFSCFAFWLLTYSDRYLIGLFRGSEEVGYYSVGFIIAERMLNFIYMILMLAATPIIIDNWEKHGENQTQKLITGVTRYFLLICVPILIILITIPEIILQIFASSKFIASAKVLPFIASAVFLNGLTHYVLKGFELHKKSINIAKLALVAGSTNITLNLILIPLIGYLGAAISVFIAYIVYFTVAILISKKIMSWNPPYRSILNISMATIILTAFLLTFSTIISKTILVITIVIPLGIFVFFSILILLKELNIHNIKKGLLYISNINKS